MAKEDRGFASMDQHKQREAARKGGKSAHKRGTAREWTKEEAREAGRKGGLEAQARRRQRLAQPSASAAEVPAKKEWGEDLMD